MCLERVLVKFPETSFYHLSGLPCERIMLSWQAVSDALLARSSPNITFIHTGWVSQL